MAKIVKNARVLIKRSSLSGDVPITGATDDHTQWPALPGGELMIYKGESFVNLADSKMWVYMDSGITEIPIMDKTVDYTPLNTQITFMKGDKLAGSTGLTFDGSDIILNGIGMSTAISTAISTEKSERISLSGETVIGLPEEGFSYSDGIFQDFDPTTRLGVAIDRFNEMFMLLAPTPPSNWNSVGFVISSPVFGARALTTGSAVPDITEATIPTFTVSVPTQGLSDATSGTLTFDVDSVVKEGPYTINVLTPNKTSGVMRYTSGDPYVGQSGKAGFWSGFTSASIAASYSALTPSSSMKTANYIHSTKGTLSETFYLDNVLTSTVTSLSSISIPTMSTRFISGVPSLASGDVITFSFNINSVSSWFYATSPVWNVTGTLVAATSGDVDTPPTTYNEVGSVTSKTTTVNNGVFSDFSFGFRVTPKKSNSTAGTYYDYLSGTKRVDTVSNESVRKTSGSGDYPAGGYGATYDSTQSLVGTYTSELMLKNGIYQFPSGNYSTYDSGPNYSSPGAGYRWVTFTTLGTMAGHSSLVLTFSNPTGNLAGVGTPYGTSGLKVQVKVNNGTTYWVDANASYVVGTNPGQTSDGMAASDGSYGSASPSQRKITFGTQTLTGAVHVRIGLNGGTSTFSSITVTPV